MDIKKYEVLLQALESGNFSKTAEKLNYTQSGISQMMKRMEDGVGFPIMVRKSSGITLTDNGVKMLPYIRALVKANHSLSEQIANLNDLKSGRVIIGTFSSFCIKFLIPIIKVFNEAYPFIKFTFYHDTSVELEKMLLENRIDLGFFCDTNTHDFDKHLILDDPMYAIVPLNHPAAKAQSISYDAFKGEPFIIPSSTGDCETSRFIIEKDIKVNDLINALNTVSAIAMVEAGLGISIISKLSLQTFCYDVACIPLSPPHSRSIYMLTNKGLAPSPATKKFAEYCLSKMTSA